jgi:hypothetical protein
MHRDYTRTDSARGGRDATLLLELADDQGRSEAEAKATGWSARCGVSAILSLVLGSIPVNEGGNSFTSQLQHQMANKTAWPELVGRNADEAVAVIKQELTASGRLTPQTPFQVLKVPDGSMVTMDYSTHRIRVFEDADGKVARPPVVG